MERGRPRTFDKEKALDAALAVFWRNGYQGASLSELTHFMGISKPSLYAAFGNKESLYLAALKRYYEQQLIQHANALASEPDLEKAMRKFLRSVATMLTDEELPSGCMVVNSIVSCDIKGLPERVVAAIRETVNQSSRGLLESRLQAELKQKKLPEGTPVEQLADYFFAVMSGMAVMAKMGVSLARLFHTVEHALCVLSVADGR